MTFEAAIVVSAIVLLATAIVLAVVFNSRHKAAREEEFKRQSTMRGWSFEAVKEGGYAILRWKGNTNGVDWIAESRFMRVQKGAVRAAVWRTTSMRGPDAPIVCMGLGRGQQAWVTQTRQGEGLLANLSKQAAAFAFGNTLNLFFGEAIAKDVDAGALKPVPGESAPGYIVVAQDLEAAAKIWSQGLSHALTSEPHDAKTPAHKKTQVLLWKSGVALGQSSQIESVEELDRLSRLGATIARVPIA